MDDKHKRISRIENVLSMLMAKADISKHFFTDQLTQEVMKEWDDMVYYEVNPITDKNAYASGSANIYLYSKPTGAFGRKNVKALDAMEEKLDKALAGFSNPHYTLQENWRDSGYDKSIQFYYNVINISVFVK